MHTLRLLHRIGRQVLPIHHLGDDGVGREEFLMIGRPLLGTKRHPRALLREEIRGECQKGDPQR